MDDGNKATVQFEKNDEVIDEPPLSQILRWAQADVQSGQLLSSRSVSTAPGAPPEAHRRESLAGLKGVTIRSGSDVEENIRSKASEAKRTFGKSTSTVAKQTFGGMSHRVAFRKIRQESKKEYLKEKGRKPYNPRRSSQSGSSQRSEELRPIKIGEMESYESTGTLNSTNSVIAEEEGNGKHLEHLKEMFLENKINVLLVFIPIAWWSYAAKWNDGYVFILCFVAMLPLASMLGVFTEELAAHTNDVIGGLINATFGNAVEMVVAIQALLAEDYRVVQASLIGSVFSNLLLVLGMCFFCGGIVHKEQEFVAQGAVACIALLGLNGLALLLPLMFGGEEDGDGVGEHELEISRIGAVVLILMYGQLLFFQLKTHGHLFEGDDDVHALIPFRWALTGLIVITVIVTLLSEVLVGSIDGFCEEFSIGRSFVGVVILPIVGNAVEHISAVTVAMKNKMDLALAVALGSAVQIGLFVLPLVVAIGACTGKDMSLKFPAFEVYLYLISVFLVSLCLANQRSNWLEGSLLVFAYVLVAVGIWFEKVPGM